MRSFMLAIAALLLAGCPVFEETTPPCGEGDSPGVGGSGSASGDGGSGGESVTVPLAGEPSYPCGAHADCEPFKMWCDTDVGACAPEKAPGAPCSAAVECCSHVCTDDVCAAPAANFPSSC